MSRKGLALIKRADASPKHPIVRIPACRAGASSLLNVSDPKRAQCRN